jgi:hypothetical protein
MKNLLIPCFVVVSLGATACNRNKSDAPAAPSVAPIATAAISAPVVVSAEAVPSASAAAALAAASASAAPAVSQIPTQEDFEKKAKVVVSSKASAAQELSKIEKEIGQ